MEPVTLIVTALALGAAAGLKPTAERAVKDAYSGLKSLIERKFAKVDLSLLEARPENKNRQAVVEEELQEVGAHQDAEILKQAQTLLDTVSEKAPTAGAAIGVNLENIKGASLELSKIIAQSTGQGSATGVNISGADIQGDIKISDVTATSISGNPQGPIFTGPVGQVGNRNINTGGGTYVERDVNTGGGDFVGRDKIDNRGGFYQPGWQVGTVNQGGNQPQPEATPPSRIKILFLTANPTDTTNLRLGEEVREIDAALRRAAYRDRFDLLQHHAVRVSDLQELLLRHNPDIVHFSGHGSDAGEIVLEDNHGNTHTVSTRALSTTFSLLKDNIRCVVLNACFSQAQAEAIAQHIDCVVGMSTAITDRAAIHFAASFYQGLAFGRNLKTAFGLGSNQIDMSNLDEADTPQLIALHGDPAQVVFVSPKA
jgi:hypothetical protein